VALQALHGESFFVASQLLVLERHVHSRARHGALVAVPTRHLLLLHVIEDARVLMAVNAVIPLAFRYFHEGPGAITPRLYWWRDGEIVHLPTEMAKEGVTFRPPESFIEEVMRPLGA
jgi:hypothetical protein